MARQRSGRRTDYLWAGSAQQVAAVDLALNTASIVHTFTNTLSRTLMRTRGNILVQLDAGANDERAMIALGLIVVSTPAATAGTASVPTPITDIGADWFWHYFATVTALAETSVTGDAGGLFERIEVDSKAMRKLKDDQTLLLVCEVGQTIDATGTFDVQAGMRYLFGS